MNIYEKFPTWLTADIIIPRLIKGKIDIKVCPSPEDRSVVIEWFNFSREDIISVPLELREKLDNELHKIQIRVLNDIGFDFQRYHEGPITDRNVIEIQNEIKHLIRKHYDYGKISLEDYFLQELGIDPYPFIVE